MSETVLDAQIIFAARTLKNKLMDQAGSLGLKYDAASIEQFELALGIYLKLSSPFTLPVSYYERRRENPSGKLLFLPADWNRLGEHSWHIIGATSQSHIKSRWIKALPPADQFLRNRDQYKKPPKFFADMSAADRAERLVRGDFWFYSTRMLAEGDVKEIDDISFLFNSDQAVALSQNARNFAVKVMFMVLRGEISLRNLASPYALFVENITRFFNHRNTLADPDAFKLIKDNETPIFYRQFNKILEQYEKSKMDEIIRTWVDQHLDHDAVEALQHIPNRQTTRMVRFLNPYKKVRHIERHANPRLSKKHISYQLDASVAAGRRALITDYPLLASTPILYDDSVKRMISDRVSSDDIAAHVYHYQGVGKPEPRVLAHLKGKNENDMDTSVAQKLPKIVAYLNFVSDISFPKTQTDWQAFFNVTLVDQMFFQDRIRNQGQSVSELASAMGHQGNWHNVVALLMPDRDHGFRAVSDVRRLLRRVGTAIVFEALDERQQEKGYEISADDLLWIAAPPEQHDTRKMPAHVRKALQTTDGRSFASMMYSHIPLHQIIQLANQYLARRELWDEWQSAKVRNRNLVGNARNQKWMGLPNLRHDSQAQPVTDELPLMVEAIDNAEDLNMTAFQLETFGPIKAASDAILKQAHFVVLRHKATGDPLCIARLREVKAHTDQHLRLSFDPSQDIWGPEGEGMDKSNAVLATLEGYVGYLNGSKLLSRPYQDARHKALAALELSSKLADITGAERQDIQARFQRLRILEDYLPVGFRARDDQSGTLSHMLFGLGLSIIHPIMDGKKPPYYRYMSQSVSGKRIMSVIKGIPKITIGPKGEFGLAGDIEEVPFIGASQAFTPSP